MTAFTDASIPSAHDRSLFHRCVFHLPKQLSREGPKSRIGRRYDFNGLAAIAYDHGRSRKRGAPSVAVRRPMANRQGWIESPAIAIRFRDDGDAQMKRRLGTKLQTRIIKTQVREGVVKIGRNEPCPCGSGEKYKRCCEGKKGTASWWRRLFRTED
jgi:hypothetical protein